MATVSEGVTSHTADNPKQTSSQMPQKEQIKTLPDAPKYSGQEKTKKPAKATKAHF
jgi:hypothetical protein